MCQIKTQENFNNTLRSRLEIKKKNINFNIKLKVVKRVKPFAPINKVCELYLQEKLSILRSGPSLNKRSEIFGHCPHRKKFLLRNLSVSTDEVSIADRNCESSQEQYRLSILMHDHKVKQLSYSIMLLTLSTLTLLFAIPSIYIIYIYIYIFIYIYKYIYLFTGKTLHP